MAVLKRAHEASRGAAARPLLGCSWYQPVLVLEQQFGPYVQPAVQGRCVQDARGDQCDKCGRLMNPTELLGPRCKLTGTVPVLRSTSHYFLDLPGLTPPLQRYITQASQQGGWSANCVQVPPTSPLTSCMAVVCRARVQEHALGGWLFVRSTASSPLLPCFTGWRSCWEHPLSCSPQKLTTHFSKVCNHPAAT